MARLARLTELRSRYRGKRGSFGPTAGAKSRSVPLKFQTADFPGLRVFKFRYILKGCSVMQQQNPFQTEKG